MKPPIIGAFLIGTFFALTSVAAAQQQATVSRFDCPAVICGDTLVSGERPVCVAIEQYPDKTRYSLAATGEKLQRISPGVVRYWVRVVNMSSEETYYYSVELDYRSGTGSLFRAVRLDVEGRAIEEAPGSVQERFSSIQTYLTEAEEALCTLIETR